MITKPQTSCVVKYLFWAFLFFLLNLTPAYSQSKAHNRSKFTIIDPTYRTNSKHPKSNITPLSNHWIYGASELESWRLQLLRKRKDIAKLKVGYPGTFHKPYTTGKFQLKINTPIALNSIKFKTNGKGHLLINNQFVASFTESDSIQSITFNKKILTDKILFDIETEDEPACLLIETELVSTSSSNWKWKSGVLPWEPAYHFPQNLNQIPPHKLEDPSILLKPESVSNKNLYDFGKELYGYIRIKAKDKPIINTGESIKETIDIYNTIKEQSLEMVNISNGIWQTKSPLAFRYLYVKNKRIKDIECKAIFRPAAYRGAFACSDDTLTKIWMNSAYTLRLCMHDFLLDGIKRDRLPWTGDLTISLLANAYSFSDSELVRRTLVALGRAGISQTDINGIIDYSLWWIIAQDMYQIYFKDSLHLKHEWKRIKETLDILHSRCDSEGFLKVTNNTWLFIDWVEQEKWTALQILWWWAQKSGAKLALRVGDNSTANALTKNAAKLKEHLTKAAWNSKENIWLSNKDSSSEITKHPNFLAIIAGLTAPNQNKGIKSLLTNDQIKPVGTPYMASFEVMALAQLNGTNAMLEYVKSYWGGMLNKGATTFWEAFNPTDTYDQQYTFYGRPYAKSLCHAWSSGPAAFLPIQLFGLKPIEDGWKRFTLNPNIGDLKWASVSVPTKFGNISVDIKKNNILIEVPKKCTLEWKGTLIKGPKTVKDKL